MNEIRDLIIGIDFGKEYTQLCYYDRKGEEPRSLTMKVGTSQYEAPTCLCWRVEQKDYCVGLEAEYFAREKGGVLIDRLYEIVEKEEKVQICGEQREPWELLAGFLNGMLRFLGVMDIVKNTKCLVITAPSIHNTQVKNFRKACEYLGFPEEKYMMMDYGESFYYYAMTQKRETWNRSVAWYAFKGKHVTFRKLTIQPSVKPALVKLEEPEETTLSGDGEMLDDSFCRFIGKTLGAELYSSIQITGDGFDQQWAQQSVKMLCFQKRKVFYGNNLFAKGACAAGKERLEDKRLRGYRYLSDSVHHRLPGHGHHPGHLVPAGGLVHVNSGDRDHPQHHRGNHHQGPGRGQHRHGNADHRHGRQQDPQNGSDQIVVLEQQTFHRLSPFT